MKTGTTQQTWHPDTCGCILQETVAIEKVLTSEATAFLDGSDDENIRAAFVGLELDVDALRDASKEEREEAILTITNPLLEEEKRLTQQVNKLRKLIIRERSKPAPEDLQVARFVTRRIEATERLQQVSPKASAARLLVQDTRAIDETATRVLWECELHDELEPDECHRIVRGENRLKNRAVALAQEEGIEPEGWSFEGRGRERVLRLRAKSDLALQGKADAVFGANKIRVE